VGERKKKLASVGSQQMFESSSDVRRPGGGGKREKKLEREKKEGTGEGQGPAMRNKSPDDCFVADHRSQARRTGKKKGGEKKP